MISNSDSDEMRRAIEKSRNPDPLSLAHRLPESDNPPTGTDGPDQGAVVQPAEREAARHPAPVPGSVQVLFVRIDEVWPTLDGPAGQAMRSALNQAWADHEKTGNLDQMTKVLSRLEQTALYVRRAEHLLKLAAANQEALPEWMLAGLAAGGLENKKARVAWEKRVHVLWLEFIQSVPAAPEGTIPRDLLDKVLPAP